MPGSLDARKFAVSEKARYLRAGYLAVIWSVLAGAIGFVCGYSGNAWLAENPGSAAPLTGIILTGPAGAAIGFLYGLISGLSSWKSRQVVIGGAALLAI